MKNFCKAIIKFIFRTVIVFVTLIVSIIVVYLVVGFNVKHRRCVQLENGLNIGYNAVFDLSHPYFLPEEVPKLPDGTPLVEGDVWPIYVSETTLYGIAFGEKGEKDFGFAWRKDTGLVRKKESPKLYEKLVSEAGDVNLGIQIDTVGTAIILREFMKRPEYTNQSCPTKLITW